MSKEISRGQKSGGKDIQAFLDKVSAMPARSTQGQGKLIFAVDATASRQPTWDMACEIQSSMFSATQAKGGLSTQLCYYRGFHEFYASPWLSDSASLQRLMAKVQCLGGQTQIGRVLQHALHETRKTKVHALVFIGDAVEEPADHLCNIAGQLGLLNVPIFVFQEGGDPAASSVLKQIAKLSGGAHCPFNLASKDALAALLGAVAVYASGGQKALAAYKDAHGKKHPEIESLSRQLPSPK